MAVRNVPQKSGRRRGHEEVLRDQAGSRNPPRVRAPRADRAGQFIYKSPQGFAEGRTTRMGSPTTLGRNRSNAQRKPSARRISPLKQLMRKQTISSQVAEAMRGQPQKGDRRRTEAERKVRRRAVRRVRALRRSGALR